ncbi:MAG: NAD(P)H-hydrate dehydratase [Phycisphaeraceae bacterium]
MSVPLPPRPQDAHKGTFGTVLVVGGSIGMIGAPALVARAAFRTGVGRVKIAAPAEVLHPIIALEPSATGFILPEDPKEALAAIDRADPEKKAILAIGPGLGITRTTQSIVEHLLADQPRAVVLDADGINALASLLRQRCLIPGSTPPRLVLTPHPGEFGRLASALGIDASPTDPVQRPHAAQALAEALSATVVLKGHKTQIAATCNRAAENNTGSAALATGGTGDVLTGTIASLLAQGMDPFNASRLAVHLHGRAADLWSQHHTDRGLLARELADHLTQAIANHHHES